MVPAGALRASRKSSTAGPPDLNVCGHHPAHSVGSLRGCQGFASPTGTPPGRINLHRPVPTTALSIPNPHPGVPAALDCRSAPPRHRPPSLTDTTVLGQPRSHWQPPPSPIADGSETFTFQAHLRIGMDCPAHNSVMVVDIRTRHTASFGTHWNASATGVSASATRARCSGSSSPRRASRSSRRSLWYGSGARPGAVRDRRGGSRGRPSTRPTADVGAGHARSCGANSPCSGTPDSSASRPSRTGASTTIARAKAPGLRTSCSTTRRMA